MSAIDDLAAVQAVREELRVAARRTPRTFWPWWSLRVGLPGWWWR